MQTCKSQIGCALAVANCEPWTQHYCHILRNLGSAISEMNTKIIIEMLPEMISKNFRNILSRAREVGSPVNPLSAGADWTNQPFSPFKMEKYKTMLKTYTKRQDRVGLAGHNIYSLTISIHSSLVYFFLTSYGCMEMVRLYESCWDYRSTAIS